MKRLLVIPALLLALASAAPAAAFYCYIPEKAGGPIPLREQPDDKARIIRLMERGSMVKASPGVRERSGWVHVRWQKEQLAKTFDASGWVRKDLIHGGECAD